MHLLNHAIDHIQKASYFQENQNGRKGGVMISIDKVKANFQ